MYRGSGQVTFTPAQIKAWEDTRAGANSPWAPLWFAPPMPADGKISVAAVFDERRVGPVAFVADDGSVTAAAAINQREQELYGPGKRARAR